MNNNRNNRRRGRGNRQQSGNNQNRIDSRARGNAPQLLDKYKKLAQDAQHNGDRVQAEYYLQFADHYFRVLADNKARQDEARAKRSDERGPDRGNAGEDGDDEDGDNRRKNNNRRPRGRRDDQDNAASSEGEAGVEGETTDSGEEPAKPRRRSRKADADDQGEKPRRKPRSNSRSRSDSDAGGSDEIDSSVLPPAIGGDDSPKAPDSDDNLETVD